LDATAVVGISLLSSDFDSVTAPIDCAIVKVGERRGWPLYQLPNESTDLLSVGDVGLSGKGFATSAEKYSPFHLCGCSGLFLAFALEMGLAIRLSLALWVCVIIVPAAVIVFLALVMATNILGRHELIIYYHHEIAVLSSVALLLRVLHRPVLPNLDIFVLGLGVVLSCGRIGCLLVGCCHGRPYRWGITYHEHHAAAGFTPYYVGIPLFPVQALESLFALVVVAFGVRIVLQGSAQGSAFTWYVIAYGFGRFCFEFLRGDPERPYFFGFSEAQWTSLILMSLTVVSEFSRTLPLRPWHLVATLALAFIMVAVTLHRFFRRTPTHRLLHPRHIREVAHALEYAATGQSWPKPQIPVGCTSLGIQISSAGANSAPELCAHYCLSRRGEPLTFEAATALAKIVCQLQHHPRHFDLLPGNNHVFHCIVGSS
jgi:uncharacterized membrane protein YoaK (UPF0700 family)